MTGYASREIIATSATQQEIEVGQAFAWNPSVTGAKAEETFVLTETGPEVITRVPGESNPQGRRYGHAGSGVNGGRVDRGGKHP